MQMSREFCLEVSGDFACYSRPEFNQQRVSYDVPTPPVVKAVFESILWKPAIKWIPTKIEVLNPVRRMTFMVNELKSLMTPKAECIYANEHRIQRKSCILRDVKYRFHALFRMTEFDEWTPKRDTSAETLEKYVAMFVRRATQGQRYTQPYLGCREFACDFRLVEDPASEQRPIRETRKLGIMFYGWDYPKGKYNNTKLKRLLYRPKMVDGVISIPLPWSEEVFK